MGILIFYQAAMYVLKSGATINLQDYNSVINVRPGSIIVQILRLALLLTCTSNLAAYPKLVMEL